MTTDNRTNEQLAERLRQFAESQAMDFDSPHVAMTLNEVADRLAGEPTKEGIPLYGMLDVWMATRGTSHPEFDQFYSEHGYAETWARLLADVRALAAADAHLPSVEQIAEEIAGHPIGSGFYQTTVGVGEAREMAEAVHALFGEVAGDE